MRLAILSRQVYAVNQIEQAASRADRFRPKAARDAWGVCRAGGVSLPPRTLTVNSAVGRHGTGRTARKCPGLKQPDARTSNPQSSARAPGEMTSRLLPGQSKA